jgi:hypothetical protein
MKKMTINVNNLINQRFSFNFFRSFIFDFVASVFFNFEFSFVIYFSILTISFVDFSVSFVDSSIVFFVVSVAKYVISVFSLSKKNATTTTTTTIANRFLFREFAFFVLLSCESCVQKNVLFFKKIFKLIVFICKNNEFI